jgi:hypothetical protein
MIASDRLLEILEDKQLWPALREGWLCAIAGDRALPPRALHVAIFLLRHLNRKKGDKRKGTAWPQIATLAAQVNGGASERTVQAAMSALISGGYVDRKLRRGSALYTVAAGFVRAWDLTRSDAAAETVETPPPRGAESCTRGDKSETATPRGANPCADGVQNSAKMGCEILHPEPFHREPVEKNPSAGDDRRPVWTTADDVSAEDRAAVAAVIEAARGTGPNWEPDEVLAELLDWRSHGFPNRQIIAVIRERRAAKPAAEPISAPRYFTAVFECMARRGEVWDAEAEADHVDASPRADDEAARLEAARQRAAAAAAVEAARQQRARDLRVAEVLRDRAKRARDQRRYRDRCTAAAILKALDGLTDGSDNWHHRIIAGHLRDWEATHGLSHAEIIAAAGEEARRRREAGGPPLPSPRALDDVMAAFAAAKAARMATAA